MPGLSVCGLDCSSCKFKEEKGCRGCQSEKGKIFWGECDLYSCCAEKKHEHCGKCGEFPCAMLKEWEASEKDGRIDNLKKLER